MKVLVIEDDSNIRRGIVDHFQSQGWEVTEAMDGQLGLEFALDLVFDVIVLDIMLPRVNGYEISRAIRREGKSTPIIMLTAKASEEDALEGFHSGTNDYVRKPFSLAELTARAKAYAQPNSEGLIKTKDFVLNPNTKILQQGVEQQVLTDKEAKVLSLLVANHGKVLTREKILNRVWGNTYMQGTRSVDRCIKTLRKKLISDVILTVRQVGYMIK